MSTGDLMKCGQIESDASTSRLECVARTDGVTVAECSGGGRRWAVVAPRAVVSKLAVLELGLPAATVARALGSPRRRSWPG